MSSQGALALKLENINDPHNYPPDALHESLCTLTFTDLLLAAITIFHTLLVILLQMPCKSLGNMVVSTRREF